MFSPEPHGRNGKRIALDRAQQIGRPILEFCKAGQGSVEVDVDGMDDKVAAYVSALSVVVSKNPYITVANAIDITSTFFTAEKYHVLLKDLSHRIDHSDNYKEFWDLVKPLAPIAKQEIVSGRGYFLINHYRAERDRRRLSSALMTTMTTSGCI